MKREIEKTDEEWRAQLGDEAYRITRQGGTEPPFTGRYCDETALGQYHCIGCGAQLFDAGHKYDSGSGWPSFWQPGGVDVLEEKRDLSHGMERTEVLCRRCGAHLGHVFPEDRKSTRLNSSHVAISYAVFC